MNAKMTDHWNRKCTLIIPQEGLSSEHLQLTCISKIKIAEPLLNPSLAVLPNYFLLLEFKWPWDINCMLSER